MVEGLGMSGVQKLDFAASKRLPLGEVYIDLTRSTCGNHGWALRAIPPEGMDAKPQLLANGFCDTDAQRAAFAGELRAIAQAVENWP